MLSCESVVLSSVSAFSSILSSNSFIISSALLVNLALLSVILFSNSLDMLLFANLKMYCLVIL